MKPPTYSFHHTRGALMAAVVTLLGAGVAAGQTSGSSSTNSDRYNSSGQSSSQNSNGSYNSGSTSGSTSGSSTYGSDTNTGSSDRSMSRDRSMSSSGKLDWSDRHFVSKVADNNQDEIQLGQLAAERATSPDVKQFAQKIVDDHTKMGSDLSTLASSKNVKVDNDKSQGRMYKRLSKASGNDFDREFVEHMIDEHEKDIKDFEKRASDAKDPEVKQFAESHLATLREHLQMAQNLRNSIVPTGRDSKTSGHIDSSTSTDKSTTGTSSSSTTATNPAANSDTGSSSTSTATPATSTETKRGGK